MRRIAILLVVFAGTTGCSTLSPTENGVLGGGALGGVTGAVIGKALGNTGAGAAVGAVAGAVAGGVMGNAVEESEKRQVTQAANARAARQLGLTDIVQMSTGKVSDAVIIGQIRSSGSMYTLSASDLQWLKESGVSDGVVIEMQQTATRGRPVVYGRPRPVYVVEEPVYVGPPVGIGVTYGHYRRW